jgi:hypothetical protein
MTDSTLSVKHSLAIYAGLWLFVLAIAFHDKPLFFYPLIGGAALAVFSVLGSFVFQQYRCYIYAKRAIKYGANAINYFVAARATEDALRRFKKDEYSILASRLLPEGYDKTLKRRLDKIAYYYSCRRHCEKRQAFYLQLLHAEGMDYISAVNDVLAASKAVADHNSAVVMLRKNPNVRVGIDDIVNAIEKVEG